MEAWLGLVGAVVGAVLGAGLTWLTARDARKHQDASARRVMQAERIAAFLSASQTVFRVTQGVLSGSDPEGVSDRRTRLGTQTRDASVVAQVALDEVRLLCDEAIAQQAEMLWHHVRDESFALAAKDQNAATKREWVSLYWELRRELVRISRDRLQ